MSRQQALQASAAQAEQPQRNRHVTRGQVQRAAYTIAEVCARISMGRSTFYRLRDAGRLPFLEEVQPRLGKLRRYRADLVEQFVANTFNRDPRHV